MTETTAKTDQQHDTVSTTASACCDTPTLSSCCEPSSKSTCCGAPAEQVQAIPPSTCGCSS